jgi:hypothetical protein
MQPRKLKKNMTNLNPDIATYSGVVGSEDITEKKYKDTFNVLYTAHSIFPAAV